MVQRSAKTDADQVVPALRKDNTASEPRSASLEQVLRGHGGVVTAAAFHPTNRIGHVRDGADDDHAAERGDDGVDDDNARRHGGATTRRPCRQMASADAEGTVTLYNVHGRRGGGRREDDETVRAYRLLGHRGGVHRLAYSPSGTLLASCAADATVRLWEPSRSYSKGKSTGSLRHRR